MLCMCNDTYSYVHVGSTKFRRDAARRLESISVLDVMVVRLIVFKQSRLVGETWIE